MAAHADDPLQGFHDPVRAWFQAAFRGPTQAQARAWAPILQGESTLLLAPTGSGKTLAAFLAALDRLMFSPEPDKRERCRVLYISPLKALAVDVERNLRAPLVGIGSAAARAGVPYRAPTIAIRSGDTPASERAKMSRTPPDIWITTPESFYLLLTSSVREMLVSVETVIVDEIHSLAATKRGAHLFLSLERLEALRSRANRGGPLQRIGLSATQRPLSEIAKLLGGGTPAEGPDAPYALRPVRIVDAGKRKPIELTVEVPIDDMAKMGPAAPTSPDAPLFGPADRPPAGRSIWPSIYPRLVELIRQHRSSMIFVNSRRLSERLASAINDAAGEELALAHHGSVAREKRQEIEDRLKRGLLRAIVATSSLELGIDMGAVDLVIQIEAPPSIASGLQRIGRAGHQVEGVSRGIVFPKYRGDLLAAAAAARRMRDAAVEETAVPENPLDVLAQQIVAAVGMDAWPVDALYAMVRCAAPFANLPRTAFEGVLDMLSGRYPSDEFAELRPRITWDRIAGVVRAREGARRIAVVNAGTIPDRGLYGVFLASDRGAEEQGRAPSRRVGELDEEMVFETKPGEVFVLGASSWRVEDITHDRVWVTPAPGEPGRMPFWHGDRPGRPLELGRAIGELARKLSKQGEAEAVEALLKDHALDERAAKNLYQYIRDQADVTGDVPSDRSLVVERYLDEMGDYRVCVLSPYGSRVHAPWAIGVAVAARERAGAEVEMLWSDDGMVFRFPQAEEPPELGLFLPSPDEIEDRVVGELGQTSLFASRFRENAARALLLPRRRPGKRSPLWAQRQRAADLLAVAARYGSFPILLETYRECLRDVFDLPGLVGLLRDIRSRKIRVSCVDSRVPSPFAASIMFSYVANFIYDQDAPLAERRAQALSVDQAQLRELLGEAEMRELLDADVIEEVERGLLRLGGAHPLAHADALHDLLLSLGDLSEAEIALRGAPPAAVRAWLDELRSEARVMSISVAGEPRHAAAEDAARFRDGLGVVLPPGLPSSFLEPVGDPLGDLVSRYARTHGPFLAESVAARFGVDPARVLAALRRLAEKGRVVEGEFLPRGRAREWCDADVLRALKRRSLAKLRKEVEPVEPAAFARFSLEWHGIGRSSAGPDALFSVIEELQGTAIAASVLENEIFPARIPSFRPSDWDALCASGEIVIRGLEPLGPRDGRIALYLTDRYLDLAPPPAEVESEAARTVLERLEQRGALFFSNLVAETRLFPGDLLEALWDLLWAGWVTNDTWAAMRERLVGDSDRSPRMRQRALARSRRLGPPGSEGRWSALPRLGAGAGPTETERRKALADQLLRRHGVLTREAVHAEGIAGGFSYLYDVLKAMDEIGRVRRGYFVAGLGATQFALPGADDRLRGVRDRPERPDEVRTVILAASDPANPYGAALPWPEREGQRPARAAGAQVVLHGGRLLAYLGRTERTLITFVPESDPAGAELRAAMAKALAALAEAGGRRALLIGQIDGVPAADSAVARELVAAGFVATSKGLFKRAHEYLHPRAAAREESD